jgi:hypothetical protein
MRWQGLTLRYDRYTIYKDHITLSDYEVSLNRLRQDSILMLNRTRLMMECRWKCNNNNVVLSRFDRIRRRSKSSVRAFVERTRGTFSNTTNLFLVPGVSRLGFL